MRRFNYGNKDQKTIEATPASILWNNLSLKKNSNSSLVTDGDIYKTQIVQPLSSHDHHLSTRIEESEETRPT